MAYIRRCTSLANGARGRRISTDVGGVSGEILLAVAPHVKEGGKQLFSILQKSVYEKESLLKEQLQTEKEHRQTEKEHRQREAEHLQREAELLKEHLQREAELLKEQLRRERELLTELLAKERESSTRLRFQLLKAQGLNNTRGLFEHIQEVLARQSMVTSRLRGADLWEVILKGDASLAACIQKCTKVPVRNVAKQALQCYNVYCVLSDHVHAGRTLAGLQMAGGGTILFEKGPLTSEQVEVFKCIGAAAKANIQDTTAS